MIAMEPYEVYRYYLALRLHFTTDQYDVIQQRGKVRASKQAFFKRKDLLAIRKVAESYSDEEIVNFLVANFVSGDRWGGIFDIESKERYLSWKKRLESISYTFEKDLGKLNLYCEKNKLELATLFISVNNQHPYIIKEYLRNSISIETLVILNKIIPYVDDLDVALKQDLIWPDTSRLIKKYGPFLNIDKSKFNGIYRRTIGYNDAKNS